MKKQNIEVEGGEFLIQSKEGHYAVIPAKHRQEVMDMVKDGCDDCINNYIQTLPKDSDYAEDGSLFPDWDKVKSTLNPKNWGVPDYSDKYKTQGEAYKNAQDKSEFLYNGVRIKKDIASDNRNSAYLQNKNYWREYKNYLSENFSDDEIEKRYNDALDLHYRYGNPKINLLSDDDAKSGKYQTSYSESLQSGRSNFTLDNTINIFYNKSGKFDREAMFDNYKQEMLHSRQLKDKGFNNFVEHQIEDFKRNNILIGDKQDYDKKMYSDLKSIEGVHILETEGINTRYNRDYKLEENPDYKHERLYILNKYKTDDFHPYQNQGDLRVIQKALSEQGYKLPKSTKKDGSFDGIWGDETKNALLDYQIKNKKK
jgi:hypothetical protein